MWKIHAKQHPVEMLQTAMARCTYMYMYLLTHRFMFLSFPHLLCAVYIHVCACTCIYIVYADGRISLKYVLKHPIVVDGGCVCLLNAFVSEKQYTKLHMVLGSLGLMYIHVHCQTVNGDDLYAQVHLQLESLF